MQPPVDTVRITKQGRDQLTKLKRLTGIEHWNTLCRWALLVSLSEKSSPGAVGDKFEGGVDIQWKIFSGPLNMEIIALLKLRAKLDGFEQDSEGEATCFRCHLHRGLRYLTSGNQNLNLALLFKRLLKKD